MKVIVAILAGVIAAVGLWYFVSLPAPQETKQITLYYYNPEFDQGPGGQACSAAGLVAVARFVPANATTAEVVNLLLKGEVTSLEAAEGIETEFPLEGVQLISASGQGKVVTLTFDDPQHQTSGGACRAGVLWLQIEHTVKAFTGASEVKALPAEVFQP